MSSAKLAVACGLAAMSLSACGITAKPIAGTAGLTRHPGNHAKIDDPRPQHMSCIVADGLRAAPFTAPGNRPAIQVGTLPTGPTVIFEPTPGAAQSAQIHGQAQAAEVIGSALVYPNQASDPVAAKVEACVAQGVKG
jgi:hypothetical protein